VVFYERPNEVGSLSCLVSIYIYIKYFILEFIYEIIPSVVVYPMP
jgi:hypothetical protein